MQQVVTGINPKGPLIDRGQGSHRLPQKSFQQTQHKGRDPVRPSHRQLVLQDYCKICLLPSVSFQ